MPPQFKTTAAGHKCFLSLHLELHMHVADILCDEDMINISLALAVTKRVAVHAYLRELTLRDLRAAGCGVARLQTLLRWGYAYGESVDLEQLLSILPDGALRPPHRADQLIPFPGGSNERWLVFVATSLVRNQAQPAMIAFGGNGAMAIAAAEGNLSALRIFLERWDWWSKHIAAVPLTVLSRRQRSEMMLSQSPPGGIDVVGCCVIAMHSRRMHRSAVSALRLVLADLPTQPSFDLKASKIRAIYSLGIIVVQPRDYHPLAQDRVFTLLAPLPDLSDCLSDIVTLVANSRRWAIAPAIIERQVALAKRWMTVWPPAPNDVASAQEIGGDDMASIVAADEQFWTFSFSYITPRTMEPLTFEHLTVDPFAQTPTALHPRGGTVIAMTPSTVFPPLKWDDSVTDMLNGELSHSLPSLPHRRRTYGTKGSRRNVYRLSKRNFHVPRSRCHTQQDKKHGSCRTTLCSVPKQASLHAPAVVFDTHDDPYLNNPKPVITVSAPTISPAHGTYARTVVGLKSRDVAPDARRMAALKRAHMRRCPSTRLWSSWWY
ncbi:hypothetical protein FN846DRAFT_890261 [Sphaerosporella brunnea]|uniref:Uncharacterized protein n=1 Tax=Sphaerosporella brunnea TaxID=1250544 RepID=A0A5J5EWI1_9PEZI|nr:hypothetical protein FN846DRAFT_890261 [Sphaerosporella brunnea]